jgi:NAD(P)-dependent dehydrogenase (short-subunit alcohol dehydrogenase family)
MGRLDNKVAIVTGASRGIGQEIAIELAREGATVAMNYLSSDARAQAVADEIAGFGGTCMLAKANVADPQEARAMVKRVAEQWGRLDVLVNNAGITRDKSLRKMTDEDWLEVVQANLNAVFFCTSAAIPVMIEQNYGRIINISSMTGQTGAFGQANYGASKGGIIAFTKTCAIELAKYNITVNAVCPGFTLTDMLAKVPADRQEQIKARIPMGRFGTPEDMAKAVTFLIEGGDYITGQQININGGAYM